MRIRIYKDRDQTGTKWCEQAVKKCCCNCDHRVRIMGHPWVTGTDSNTQHAWGCDGQAAWADEGSAHDHDVGLGFEHGLCELWMARGLILQRVRKALGGQGMSGVQTGPKPHNEGATIMARWIEGNGKWRVFRWSTSYSIHGLGGHWVHLSYGGQYGDMHLSDEWIPADDAGETIDALCVQLRKALESKA